MTTATVKLSVSRKPVRNYLSSLTTEDRAIYERIPEEIDYVYHESFSSPDTEQGLFGDGAEKIDIPGWTQFPQVHDERVVPRSGRAVLKGPEERTLFLRFNYARYMLAGLIEAQRCRKSSSRAGRMVKWYRRAMKVRAHLVRANMALVVAMARRTRIPNVEFSELISEGNMALLRSIEKFDVSRGFKLSTYACRAILKSFNRLATKTGKYHQRFATEFKPEMEQSDYDVKKHEMKRADSLDSLREIIQQNRAELSELEWKIVTERFPLSPSSKNRTLAEVGRMVGLTNERVRQVQNRALEKIRQVLDEEYLAA